ncbi:MAG: FG-GAP repeat domain-containing protein, partial [Planctomycetota bacterium]
GLKVRPLLQDVRSGWPRLVAGDWSGDGAMDLVISQEGPGGDRKLMVMKADKKGGFERMPDAPALTASHAIPRPFLADLDADGKADLIMCWSWPGQAARLITRLSLGDGSFETTTSSVLKEVDQVDVGLAAYIDGDAHLDFYFHNQPRNELLLLFGDGKGGFVGQD